MKRFVIALISLFILFLTPTWSNANEYHQMVRVGISTNNFKRLYYSSLSIGALKPYTVYEKHTGAKIITMSSYKWLRVTMTGGKFNLFSGGNLVRKGISGPIGIKSSGNLKVMGLKRKGKRAYYRGEFELTEAFTKKNRFNLINVLPLEQYLKGVVPNEIPVRFGLEAVKAQTVAARNYTLRPRVKVFHNFDVCDTVHSQVYFGAATEMPLANQAIQETQGLFALHKGDVILALYSSTAGGHTENFENVFSSPVCSRFPSEPLPYLIGKPDFPLDKKLILSEDKFAESFYNSCPKSFDSYSKYYRWQREWDSSELAKTLRQTLKDYSNTGFITPAFTHPSELGKLKSIKILSRGVSGKAIAIEIETTKGKWVVKKELIIRRVFKKVMKSLPSANIIINQTYDKNKNLCKIKFTGGGFGHGVGLSQYGAGSMAAQGYKFENILQHYYTGIALGTYPLDIKDEPRKMSFISPNEKGELVLKNPDKIEDFAFKINDVEINLDKNILINKNNITRIKLDKYIKKHNVIEFLPLANSEKSVRVWVEVYRAKE